MQPLAKNLDRVYKLHQHDLRKGAGYVELPFALNRKYPSAARDCVWQWDSGDKTIRGPRKASASSAPHSRDCHPASATGGNSNGPDFEAGYDIRTIQELLGHRDVTTTVYTHVAGHGGCGVKSPLDTPI